MTPEKEVQNAIISYFKNLRDKGIDNYVERRQAGGFSYKIGLPDLWVIIQGRHIEIEVKQANGNLRATQEKWAKRFEQLGVIYICAKSVDDVKDVIDILINTSPQLRCKYCGCTKITFNSVATHIGAYCVNCGKWIKWVKQNEVTQYFGQEQNNVDVKQNDNIDLPWT